MIWNQYEENYIRLAKINGKSNNYCINQLEYAKELFDKDLPIIYNQEHLCLLVGYSKEYVYAVCNSPNGFYRTFKILKKNGKERIINEPYCSVSDSGTVVSSPSETSESGTSVSLSGSL